MRVQHHTTLSTPSRPSFKTSLSALSCKNLASSQRAKAFAQLPGSSSVRTLQPDQISRTNSSNSADERASTAAEPGPVRSVTSFATPALIVARPVTKQKAPDSPTVDNSSTSSSAASNSVNSIVVAEPLELKSGTDGSFSLAPEVPEDLLKEFEDKLEADVQTVGVTLSAILGVIIFWRGVWSLLDHYIGDSVLGHICCTLVGLSIVLYIRLSGLKVASFWPPA